MQVIHTCSTYINTCRTKPNDAANTAVSLVAGAPVRLILPRPLGGLGDGEGYLLEVEKTHTLAGILCNIKDMGEGVKESENSKITWCGAGLFRRPITFRMRENM